MAEPFRLRRWKAHLENGLEIQFFTCARPGRSKGSNGQVLDDNVDRWVKSLPGGQSTTVISLLGRKQTSTGTSEFSFYSFHGILDNPAERRGKPSFQEWLDRHHPDRGIQLLELPTIDFKAVDQTTLEKVSAALAELSDGGRTIVIMDSGGFTRTGAVCSHLKAKELTGHPMRP
ncbi:MAG: hypothetical protein WD906_01640 [Anaerolineales bacterium]